MPLYSNLLDIDVYSFLLDTGLKKRLKTFTVASPIKGGGLIRWPMKALHFG